METLTLKAETSRLLDLVVNSLYTNRDIFLRELITNASDALDRLRFEVITRPELLDCDHPHEIHIDVDASRRTLTVRDHGIGMSRDEVVDHIGTIARSGTQEFETALRQHRGPGDAFSLIGRFGVGFYSCFMVADRVTLVTCRAGQKLGTRWESTGDVHYTLDDVADAPRGTSVTLHLKQADLEAGIDDYTERSVLSRVVKRYADYVTHPIVLIEQGSDAGSKGGATGSVLNSMQPIWTRRPAEVAPDEFDAFYKHLSEDWSQPLLRMSFKAEGRWEYLTLLFVPAHASFDLYYPSVAYGLQLYSNRLLIVERCEDLLPRYLRFVKGVVDAADLPLNVSRQSLQDAHHLTNIRKWVTRKIIDAFQKMQEEDAEKFEALWREFGRALKEGITEDYDNKERLTSLLRFASSFDSSKLTSLSDYVSRMPADQKEIYYLSGGSPAILERSPHAEALRARNYEVLYFWHPVDELAAQAISEFQGHRLRSAAAGVIELGEDAEREQAAVAMKEHTEALSGVLKCVTTHLEQYVRDVRVSRRLTASPACLAGEELAYSPRIERLLKGDSMSRQRRTLELNPTHPIVTSLKTRLERDPTDPLLKTTADLLFGYALVAEGGELPNPAMFNEQLIDVLMSALDPVAKSLAVASKPR